MLGTSKEIKNPGLNILPPGVERHVVNGGALTAFQIFPDDENHYMDDGKNSRMIGTKNAYLAWHFFLTYGALNAHFFQIFCYSCD